MRLIMSINSGNQKIIFKSLVSYSQKKKNRISKKKKLNNYGNSNNNNFKRKNRWQFVNWDSNDNNIY